METLCRPQLVVRPDQALDSDRRTSSVPEATMLLPVYRKATAATRAAANPVITIGPRILALRGPPQDLLAGQGRVVGSAPGGFPAQVEPPFLSQPQSAVMR
jgi:hypothetical protein